MHYNSDNINIFVVLCVGLAVRSIVSLSSYSGASKPPLFGDYEAQRHWQEITLNLPAKYWYTNRTDNDLLYWGLDYPPLTAYHSLGLGMVANILNSSYVELFRSRGFESNTHKSFMRLTVLAADMIIYFPAVVSVFLALKSPTTKNCLAILVLMILYPCQILIDNGHFQYNNISLGLFLFSVTSILKNHHKTASIAFALALNYKQMELYHALPIFVYLLKTSVSNKSVLKNISKFLEVGLVTAVTFILLWIPWISSIDSFSTAVLRLFPFNRGVFEDKVANVWCSLHAIYKFKEKYQNSQMAMICLSSTLTAIIPTNVHLYFNLKKETFLFSLVNTSLAFFLLSFQVHEKTILLAAIPICLLFHKMPFTVLCFLKISTFSVLPLLIKDNLCVVYFCMMVSYIVIFKNMIEIVHSKDEAIQRYLNVANDILDFIILASSAAALLLPPPERLPYLWPFLISFFSCIYFVMFLLKSNYSQFSDIFESFQTFKLLTL